MDWTAVLAGYIPGSLPSDDAGVTSLMSGAAKTALGMAVADGRGDQMVSQMTDFYADLFKGK